PVPTNSWLNTLGNTLPKSHVLPLAEYSDQPSIAVSWMPDSGIVNVRDYTICVAEDGAPYRVWRQDVVAMADTLVPPKDHHMHQYAFYSVARDASGNVEADPGVAEATTQSRTGVGNGPLQLALAGARPNPATGGLRVSFRLPSREPASLDLLDIAGRRVIRREVGSLGPGAHTAVLAATEPLRPGLYFLRLIQGPRELTARVAVIR